MTTAETMLNARTVRDWMLKSIPGAASVDVIRQQFIACRSSNVLS
jgi:glucose-6-phosphate isomerase